MIALVIHAQGDKREVPPGVPALAWIEEMREVAVRPDRDELLASVSFYHPVMEYLEPALLLRFKIQAVVWYRHVGEWPSEVAYWWPVRLGRRPKCRSCNYRSSNNTEVCNRCFGSTDAAQVPSQDWSAGCGIDEAGALICGFCGARWSANADGSSHKDRCSLCDRISVVITDERKDYVTSLD